MKKANFNKKLINMINYTIADTNYVKDDATPFEGILRSLLVWFIVYFIGSLVLYFYQSLGNYYMLFENQWYFPLSRFINIFLFSSSLILYFIFIHKTNMSLKEKDFLKTFSIVLILLIFSRMIYPLSYYLNSSVLIGLYDTISLDLLVLILSSVLLNSYFKTKLTKRLIILNTSIFIINLIIFSLFVSVEIPSLTLIFVQNSLTILRDNGIFVILNFSIILMAIFYKSRKQWKKT